jgi:hypothetical protein
MMVVGFIVENVAKGKDTSRMAKNTMDNRLKSLGVKPL